MASTEERAERLRVLISLAPYLPMPPEEASTVLTDDECEVIEALTHDDLALANACLRVEGQLRRDQFDAVERLGALVAAGEGDLEARVLALPERQRIDAFRAVMDALWVDY